MTSSVKDLEKSGNYRWVGKSRGFDEKLGKGHGNVWVLEDCVS